GSFNEDNEGGIHFNKSLTYQYQFFVPGAGEYPVSEPENRALLDELYTKMNIYAIFTFGPGNNLSSPWRYNARGASQRIVTSIQERDAELNKLISDQYNKTVGLKDAPASVDQGGDFYQWAYFHFGRLSLSTPGWWAPMVKGDSTMKPNADKNREVNFLRWAAQEGLTDYYQPWKTVSHPDFAGSSVEVGGISPYAMMNPPLSMIGDVSKKHNQFIVDLAAMQASLQMTNLKVEAVGKGMTRITVDLYNQGTMPTHTEMGARSRWLRNIRVQLKLGNGQQIVSGRNVQQISSISGDSSEQLTWLVKGSGNLTIEAGAPHVGFISTNVNLK
ncbi:MAG TPA: peptidase, partial [Roseivirga sp.]